MMAKKEGPGEEIDFLKPFEFFPSFQLVDHVGWCDGTVRYLGKVKWHNDWTPGGRVVRRCVTCEMWEHLWIIIEATTGRTLRLLLVLEQTAVSCYWSRDYWVHLTEGIIWGHIHSLFLAFPPFPFEPFSSLFWFWLSFSPPLHHYPDLGILCINPSLPILHPFEVHLPQRSLATGARYGKSNNNNVLMYLYSSHFLWIITGRRIPPYLQIQFYIPYVPRDVWYQNGNCRFNLYFPVARIACASTDTQKDTDTDTDTDIHE